MFRLLLGMGIGLGLGLLVIAPRRAAASERALAASESGPGGAPAARMARDFRRACRDLDPLMRQLERSLADGSLSAADALALTSQVRQLV